jgi:hypothetical protein
MTKDSTSLPDTMLDDVPLDRPLPSRNPNKGKQDYSHAIENLKGAVGQRPAGEPAPQKTLYNKGSSQFTILREKPVHATMAAMAANGYDSIEIGKHLGYSAKYVRDILNQPFAQDRMIGIAEKNSREEIKAFLEAEIMPSLNIIKSIAHNVAVAPAVRGNMANLLVERFLGKAVQPIDPNAKPVSEMKDEDLKADVESILQQTRAN